MSIIRDRTLYSEQAYEPICIAKEQDTLIRHVLERARAIVANDPERKWMTDVADITNPQTRFYSDIEPMAIKMAHAFLAQGVLPGDVVQVYLENCVDYFIILFGAWLCGAKVSTCDPTMTVKTVQLQLKETQAKLVVCSPLNQHVIQEAWSSLMSFQSNNLVVWSSECMTDVLDAPALPLPDLTTMDVDEVGLIFWSSGTTGLPKGIQWTHRNLINFMDPVDFPPSTLYTSTMFYHIGGFNIPMSCCLFGNFHAIFHGGNYDLKSEDIFWAAHQYQTRLMLLGSHHAVRLASDRPHPSLDCSSLLAISPLGSAVYSNILEDLRQSFVNLEMILMYYGLTEVGPITNNISPESLGPLRNGRMARVVDPETGALLGPHEQGEILVKSVCMFSTYLNRPDLTREAITEDGFFRTGDLGCYDEEGCLYFHDRLKDLMKYKNHHVYPGDIEAIIQMHPDVVEVAVFGKPDPMSQELISAVVVKTKGSNLTADDIRALVNANVEDYKHLRGDILFVDALPRSLQGKVLRKTLLGLCPVAVV